MSQLNLLKTGGLLTSRTIHTTTSGSSTVVIPLSKSIAKQINPSFLTVTVKLKLCKYAEFPYPSTPLSSSVEIFSCPISALFSSPYMCTLLLQAAHFDKIALELE
jgi:hypothetical protein